VIAEQATNTTAVGAITSPFWLPPLHDISSTFTEWAPTFGCMWIVIQVGFKIYDRFTGRDKQ
jgi:hypothetical protein